MKLVLLPRSRVIEYDEMPYIRDPQCADGIPYADHLDDHILPLLYRVSSSTVLCLLEHESLPRLRLAEPFLEVSSLDVLGIKGQETIKGGRPDDA